MPNFEYLPQQQNAKQKIDDLNKQINELETTKKDALVGFDIKPEKGRDKEIVKVELPGVKDLRKVDYVKDDKGKFHFEYVDANNQKRYLMPGDLFSDMEWGVYYDLNHDVIAAEYRKKYDKFRKKYLETFYQRKIEHLATEQLLIQRLEIDKIGDRDYYLGQAYTAIHERLKKEDEGGDEQAGFLFEKMIKGILTKIATDLGEKHNFSVQNTSIIDDVELKADLVVNLPQKNRGVGVEESKKAKGIQLTLVDKNDAKFRRKVEQVQKIKEQIKKKVGLGGKIEIDDLVLLEVEVGNKDIMSKYNQWVAGKKNSGGPENLFSVNQILEFLGGIFQDSDLDLQKNPQFKEDVWKYFKDKI
ncbi:hypothetical protein JW977_03970 [Candidatus Falkowbacteria bacterium]|nr:hypothetical protein [Candidatus Falkowbacteria bacterium]